MLVQNIILRLQQKAHASLDEFRRSKDSPISKYHHSSAETSPASEEDELSILGGKTRLVSKKDTLSPIFTQRSPISQTPVVPLPLSPGPLPPSVRDYLRSFKPRFNGVPQDPTVYSSQQFGHHTTSLGSGSFESISPQEQARPMFSPADMAQSPFYSPQSTFGDPMISYLPQQQPRAAERAMPPPHGLEVDTGVRESDMGFPQYLPVYDYSLASAPYVNGSGALFGTTDQPVSVLVDTNQPSVQQQQLEQRPPTQHYHQQRRASDSPDGNMQTTWFDFVNSMGCVGVMGH